MARYTIHAIDSEACDSCDSHVLDQTDDLAEAVKLTEPHSNAIYGCAIRDSESGLIDFGYGFGVPCPEPR